jgi:hypothetical protein
VYRNGERREGRKGRDRTRQSVAVEIVEIREERREGKREEERG